MAFDIKTGAEEAQNLFDIAQNVQNDEKENMNTNIEDKIDNLFSGMKRNDN